jgi:hypothetical protein
MNRYALINTAEQLLEIRSFGDGEVPVLAQEKGLQWVLWEETQEPAASPTARVSRTLSVQNGVAKWVYTVTPLVGAELDAALVSLRAQKNASINTARMRANTSTFEFDGKPIACDELSRSDIDGVAGYIALFGEFPPGWPGAWKAADNTYVPMTNIAHFRAMYAAMASAGLANFARAQSLKAELAAAQTAEEIEAIAP